MGKAPHQPTYLTLEEPLGWGRFLDYPEYGPDFLRWLKGLEWRVRELELVIKNGHAGGNRGDLIRQLASDQRNLAMYGSSNSRPGATLDRFLNERMFFDGVAGQIRRWQEEQTAEVDQKEVAEKFLVRHPRENLASFHHLLFQGDGLRGWITENERINFGNYLRRATSEEEKSQFRELEAFSGLETEVFEEIWAARCTVINWYIHAFEGVPAPKERVRLGHTQLIAALDFLGIKISLEDIQKLTKEAIDLILEYENKRDGGEPKRETKGQMTSDPEFFRLIEAAMAKFSLWLQHEIQAPQAIINKMTELLNKGVHQCVKAAEGDNKSALSGSVDWMNAKINLQAMDFWNQLRWPASSVEYVMFHELIHLVIQMLGNGVKMGENMPWMLEFQAQLGELIWACNNMTNEDDIAVVMESMKRRAAAFDISLDMHAEDGEEKKWEELLSQKGIPKGLVDKSVESLLASPMGLQMYWVFILFFAANFDLTDKSDLKKKATALFKNVMNGGDMVIFEPINPPITDAALLLERVKKLIEIIISQPKAPENMGRGLAGLC